METIVYLADYCETEADEITAQPLYEKVQALMNANHRVIIDFADVKRVNKYFIKAFFSAIIDDFGKAQMKSLIVLKNYSARTLSRIQKFANKHIRHPSKVDYPEPVEYTAVFMKTHQKSNHYISQHELQMEMQRSMYNGRMTERLGEMVILMVSRIQNPYKYLYQGDKEDCATSAITHFCKCYYKCDAFNRSPASVFSWCTSTIFNAIHGRFRILQKNRAISLDNIFTTQ